MPQRPALFRPHGSKPKAEAEREADARRGSARDRGYDTRWDKARRGYLAAHPVCEYCRLDGVITPLLDRPMEAVVDHLYPHRGDKDLFWRSEWWVASCKSCHDGMKQRAEWIGRPALDALARRLGRPILAHPRGVVESSAVRF